MSSNESLSYLLHRILNEPAPEPSSEPQECWQDREWNRPKVSKVNDKPPRLISEKDYKKKMTPSSMESTYTNMTRTKLR